jgi:3'(2'), 5'-bisphosphate nucleotidase
MPDFEITDLLDATYAAGDAAMEIYRRDHDVAHKADNSPVTEADLAVDRILGQALADRYPSIPLVTEERVSSHDRSACGNRFFLVDPIDGTKEFIKRTGEFTINIALIEDGEPVAGIVYAPASDRLFVGQKGRGASEIKKGDVRRPITARICGEKKTAVASRSHLTRETEDFISANEIGDCVNAGSSLKFCLVAAGEADIYPRFGPTMEWDTAAGQAVLCAAGGQVLTCDGEPLSYGKPEFRNPFFIASTPSAAYTIPESANAIHH